MVWIQGVRRSSWWLLWTIFLTLPLTVGSAGLEVAAHQAAVLKVSGSVQAQIGARPWSPLNEGSVLQTGDRIKTGSDGFAAVILSDQTVLKLADNTELVLVDLRLTEQANLIRRFQVKVGRVWSDVTPMERSGSVFEIEGPQATAAVKGTAFEVDASDGQTEVRVWEGAVEASAQGQAVLLGADRSRFRHDRFQSRADGRVQRLKLDRSQASGWQKWNLENRRQLLQARTKGQLDRGMLNRYRNKFRQAPSAQTRRQQLRKQSPNDRPSNRRAPRQTPQNRRKRSAESVLGPAAAAKARQRARSGARRR